MLKEMEREMRLCAHAQRLIAGFNADPKTGAEDYDNEQRDDRFFKALQIEREMICKIMVFVWGSESGSLERSSRKKMVADLAAEYGVQNFLHSCIA